MRLPALGSASARRGAQLAIAAFAAATAAPLTAQAQCPVGHEILVDYDVPGSGYSEDSNNWTSWATAPCHGATYRYLSHTVGDGTRHGRAIFQPAITHAGHWQFRTGYRATENRSSDADYVAYDDLGGIQYTVVDQRGDGCVWVDLGIHYCEPGGACRVVLDGTDDSQSDCADVTTFTLVDCTEPGDAGAPDSGVVGRCDGIRAVATYEVCEETATTCVGVYADGSGCTEYCAAAGMTCVARFGGEPNCQKEPGVSIPCDENNSHLSDWCECEGPSIEPDAGTGGIAGAGGTGTAGQGGSMGTGAGGAGATSAGGIGQGAGAMAGHSAVPGPDATPEEEGGCGCRVSSGEAPHTGWGLLAFGVGVGWSRRHRSRRSNSEWQP